MVTSWRPANVTALSDTDKGTSQTTNQLQTTTAPLQSPTATIRKQAGNTAEPVVAKKPAQAMLVKVGATDTDRLREAAQTNSSVQQITPDTDGGGAGHGARDTRYRDGDARGPVRSRGTIPCNTRQAAPTPSARLAGGRSSGRRLTWPRNQARLLQRSILESAMRKSWTGWSS